MRHGCNQKLRPTRIRDKKMSKAAKILVTIIVIVVFIALFAAITGSRQDAGASTPGMLGLVVFAGLIGAITAIWKKGGDDKNKSVLQK